MSGSQIAALRQRCSWQTRAGTPSSSVRQQYRKTNAKRLKLKLETADAGPISKKVSKNADGVQFTPSLKRRSMPGSLKTILVTAWSWRFWYSFSCLASKNSPSSVRLVAQYNPTSPAVDCSSGLCRFSCSERPVAARYARSD